MQNKEFHDTFPVVNPQPACAGRRL